MSITNFRSIHDQTNLSQKMQLGSQPLLGDRLIPFPNTNGRIIQEAAQSPGQTHLRSSAGYLSGYLAEMNRTAFINTNQQPHKVADLGNPGFRLQGNRILIPSSKDFKEVIFLPTGLELFGMDTTFGSFLLFEQIESNMAQD